MSKFIGPIHFNGKYLHNGLTTYNLDLDLVKFKSRPNLVFVYDNRTESILCLFENLKLVRLNYSSNVTKLLNKTLGYEPYNLKILKRRRTLNDKEVISIINKNRKHSINYLDKLSTKNDDPVVIEGSHFINDNSVIIEGCPFINNDGTLNKRFLFLPLFINKNIEQKNEDYNVDNFVKFLDVEKYSAEEISLLNDFISHYITNSYSKYDRYDDIISILNNCFN